MSKDNNFISMLGTGENMIEHIYIKRAMRYSKDGKLDREITSEDICYIPYEPSHRIGF